MKLKTYFIIFFWTFQSMGAMVPFGFWVAPLPSQTEFRAGYGQETCLIARDGRMKCWGNGTNGMLGRGNTSNVGTTSGQMGVSLAYINLGTGKLAAKVSPGISHVCVVLTDGSLKCWGANEAGQLGLGNTTTYGDNANEMGDNLPAINLGAGRTAVSVATGGSTTCAILDNNALKCWGYGGAGTLGYGNGNLIGTVASDMGDNLAAVNLGTGRYAKKIMIGQSNHACAILDNDTVKCWGDNTSGALGLGDTTNRGSAANQMGDNLPAVSLGTGRTALAVAGGYTFTCALLDNSTVKCWGAGSWGNLGQGNTTARGDGANEMGDNLPAINLGTGRTAKAIATGGDHACAILDNDTVKCWGRNDMGQLGLGDTASRGDNANEMGDNLPAVNLGTGAKALAISAADQATCVILNGGRIKCWGDNSSGQLGLGDTTARGSSAAQMGDSLPYISWY